MVNTQPFQGYEILIKVGDGGGTETFAHPCLINASREVGFESDTSTSEIIDCDNPGDPSWENVNKTIVRFPISGSGTVHKPDIGMFDAWASSDEAKNCEIEVGGTGGRLYTGAWKCTSFKITGERKEDATVQIELINHGPVTSADVV